MQLLIWGALIVGFFYFVMIRPGKKRMDDQKALLNSLTPGVRVMLTSGLYGTVRDIGVNQAVVELSPGYDVTVAKAAVARVVGPDDEEFEYEEYTEDESEGYDDEAIDFSEGDRELAPTDGDEPDLAYPGGAIDYSDGDRDLEEAGSQLAGGTVPGATVDDHADQATPEPTELDQSGPDGPSDPTASSRA